MVNEGSEVPAAVFRVVLPALWVLLIGGVAANRWRLAYRLGRDPIVMRPWRKADSPTGYLERALSLCTVVLTIDVALNAVWPSAIANTLGVKALRECTTSSWVGLALITVGFLLGAVAVTQMGASWRIGIDNLAPGPLVANGLYARVRHPIYGGMLLATTGMAAVTADLLSIAVAAAAWVGLPIQARLEEAFLLSRDPVGYRSYLERTGRFWPRIG